MIAGMCFEGRRLLAATDRNTRHGRGECTACLPARHQCLQLSKLPLSLPSMRGILHTVAYTQTISTTDFQPRRAIAVTGARMKNGNQSRKTLRRRVCTYPASIERVPEKQVVTAQPCFSISPHFYPGFIESDHPINTRIDPPSPFFSPSWLRAGWRLDGDISRLLLLFRLMGIFFMCGRGYLGEVR